MSDKHCYNCAYRKEVPGNCHIECTRDFKGIKKPVLDAYGVKRGWCFFPMLFDPVWVGECKGFSEKADHIRKEDPLLTVMAILGSIGR